MVRGTDNEAARHQREGAKETRIDGVIANSMAIPYIRSYRVENNPMTPTHYVVKLRLNLSAPEEPRTFITTLPTLKGALDRKIEEAVESIEYKKEKAEKAKEMKQH